MAHSHSVACPSCGASIKIVKDSSIGKRVRCPSCKEPFTIELPKQEYVPLLDDGPLASAPPAPKSGTRKAAPASESIPLLDDEPGLLAPPKSGVTKPQSKSEKSDSKVETVVTDRRKKSSGEVKARSSKSDQFVSRAESSEFDAMMADSSGTDLFDDDASKPAPPRRAGKRGGVAADAETSEFDSMLADTDEEQTATEMPMIRRKPRTNFGTDETDSLPTVEMDENDGLPLAPLPRRALGGWRPAQQGPIVVWTCIGAGVCLLLLVYILFTSRPSSTPPLPAVAAPSATAAESQPEVADSERNPPKGEAAETAPSENKPQSGHSDAKGSEQPLKASEQKAGGFSGPDLETEEAAVPNPGAWAFA